MSDEQTPPLAISAEEAGRLLGCSKEVIYQLLDQQKLPELPRWTRRRLIPRAAIERVVEESMAEFDPKAVLGHGLKAAS